MKLIQPQQRRKTEMELIPLINVVFLLLVFFMIAGAIAPSDVFQVEPPESAQPTVEIPSVILNMDANGNLALHGRKLDSKDDLQARLSSLDAQPILVKADAGVQMRELRSLMDVLAAAGFIDLYLETRNP